MSKNKDIDLSMDDILIEFENQDSYIFGGDPDLDEFVLKPDAPDIDEDGDVRIFGAPEEAEKKEAAVPREIPPVSFGGYDAAAGSERASLLSDLMAIIGADAKPTEEPAVIEPVPDIEEPPVIEESPVVEEPVAEESPVAEKPAVFDIDDIAKLEELLHSSDVHAAGEESSSSEAVEVVDEIADASAPKKAAAYLAGAKVKLSEKTAQLAGGLKNKLGKKKTVDEELADESADSGEYAEPVPPHEEPAPEPVQEKKSFSELVVKPVISALSFIGMKLGESKSFIMNAPDLEEKDLGPEVKLTDAEYYYASNAIRLGNRMKLAFLFTLILMYISLGLPVFGALNSITVSSAVCVILLLTVMLLGIDVVGSGLFILAEHRFNAYTLVSLSCIFSVIDGIIIACGVKTPGLPFCAVSALTVSMCLLGSFLNCEANRRVFGNAASRRPHFTVSAESELTSQGVTLLKSFRGSRGFVRRVEEAGPDELAYAAIAPIVVPAALLFSLIATAINKSWSSYCHVLSGILVIAAPATMLLSYSLPFFVSSVSLADRGSCIAGWSGLNDIGRSGGIIITDNDLFEYGSVRVKDPMILSNIDPMEVITLAGTVICASECAMKGAFEDYMAKFNLQPKEIKDGSFTCLMDNGYSAIIDGRRVICGNSACMKSNNIQLVDKVIKDNCVYMVVGDRLWGIFEMEYIARDSVKRSLTEVLQSSRTPIFATRDFNISPVMLSNKFNFPMNVAVFPDFVDRFKISGAKPSEFSRPAAMISQSGLGAYAALAEHGKRLFKLIHTCNIVSVASAIFGMLLMTILLACGAYSAAGVTGAIIYMLATLVPQLVMTLTFRSK